MALTCWNERKAPTSSNALRDLESHFARVFGDGGWLDAPWTPSVDIHETEDAFTIEVDLPGVDKKDIELSTVDNVLTIKGERKETRDESGAGYRRSERRYGTFERSFAVPGGFSSAKIAAAHENGVLRVTLPKREEDKPKQIEVK